MTRVGAAAIVVLALAAGLALRLTRIDSRPMHHDEANQAVKFATLLETGVYRYDARDHHGPTLYYLTLPAAWARGQHTLASLDERTLRGVPAVFGAATILLPLLLFGPDRTATIAGAWLMALSPAMVFYSRMFIQESLFACFTLGFVIALGRVAIGGGLSWSALAGAAAGLALATKETSVIVLPAAVAACAFARWSLGPVRPRSSLAAGRWRLAAVVFMLAAATIAALFYSSFFAAPGNILAPLSAASTYLSRGTDAAGHGHPWHYYLVLLSYSSSGGLRWSEAVVLMLAIVGAVNAFGASRSTPDRATALAKSTRMFWARYLTSDVLIVASIFSAIPYKTPWNLLPFYVCAIVLAGIGFSALVHATRSRTMRSVLAAAFVMASGQLAWQAWRASVTYASDPRNPYVYAQTLPDIVRMATRIRTLATMHPDGRDMPVSVIASPYEQWPLPWYLRSMPHVGYWTAPGDALAMQSPVIVSSANYSSALDKALGDRYVSEFYGLRPEVFLMLHVERGLWDRFLGGGSDRRTPPAP